MNPIAIIGAIATILGIFISIGTLIWKMSQLAFQVKVNSKDIEGVGEKLSKNLVPVEIIKDMKAANDKHEKEIASILKTMDTVLYKLDLLLKKEGL